MSTKIFVNLPVQDLAKSRAFFAALGYGFDERFCDDNAICLVISEDIYAMLLTEPFFKGFTKKAVADARTSTEVMLALSADSRAAVDDLADKAVAAGGRAATDPLDYGFMYSRDFADGDGHLWGAFWMDPAAVPPSDRPS